MSTDAAISMTAHPLRRKLSALRRGARRLVVARAIGSLTAVVVSLLVILGLVDYAVRIRDPGLRWMASAAFWSTAAWVAWRRLIDPLTVSWRDTELALCVERRFPWLGDRLASAVDFLHQAEDDPLAGSAALRRAAIARATAETEMLDFGEALDARPAARALAAGVVTSLVATILAASNPAAATTAVARAMNPISRAAWPQQTHWQLVRPVERIARGRPFEIEVVDAAGAPLPDEARIHYRFENPDGAATIESESMRRLGDRFVARRESVARSFAFRVEGGDDSSMPWQQVEVVDPPSVREPAIELSPPAYTGWPTEQAEGNLRALVGTKLRLFARSDKPLSRAVLRFEDGGSLGAALDADGRGIVAPAPGESAWVVDRSRKWWLELVDRDGIVGGGDARWEIAAVPDHPPSVAVEQSGASVYVTPEAVVPVRIVAKDDLAIRRVALVCQPESPAGAVPPSEPASPVGGGEPREATDLPSAAVSAEVGNPGRAALSNDAATVPRPATIAEAEPATAEPTSAGATPPVGADAPDRRAPAAGRTIVLVEGPDAPPVVSVGSVAEILAGALQWADRRSIDHRWDIASLGLRPGEQLVFRAEATDYRGQTQSSEARRLIVITPEQLQQRIAARFSAILAELQRLRDVQAHGRSSVEAVRLRWNQRAPIEQADVDRIQGAELAERQVARGLTHRGEGVAMHVVGLLEDLENNRLARGDLERRLRALLDELDRLDREHLTPALRALTAASKDAQVRLVQASEPVADDSLPAAALQEAEGHQVQVLERLGALIAQLVEWDNYHRFHREIGRLLQDQQDVARRAAEMARQTLSRELEDLAPRELADLRVVAAAQSEIGRRLEVIQQEMGVMREQLREADPLAADALADALDEARRTAVGARVRAAADHLRSNRIAQALADQKQIADDLQSLLDILAGRHERELDRLVAKLREADRELAETQSRQAELRRAFEAAAAMASGAQRAGAVEQLASRQETLGQESRRLARRLERLAADRAAVATRRAGDRMSQAGAGAAAGDSSRAASEAAAAEQALAEARRELAFRRAQAEAELALEQLARLEDAVKHLRRQQEQALEETRRLEAIRTAEGRLSRSQLLSVADLARLQQALHDDARRLADELGGAGIFRLAIAGAVEAMDAAAGLLQRQRTDRETQDLEQHAIRRLDLLLEALAPESPENGSEASGAGDQPAGAPGEGVATLTELKLVRLLQQDLHQQTAQLDHDVAAGGGRPTSDQQRAYLRLAEQQARLAELLLDLIAPPAPGRAQDGEAGGDATDQRDGRGAASAPDRRERQTAPKEHER